MNNESRQNDVFTEDDSSFDILGWLLKILKYWYLFVISVGICVGVAYFKNKSWKPIYVTSARIILGESEGGFSAPSDYGFMQGFGGSSSRGNMTNQLILLSSRDIISKAINRLDFMVDYYTKGRFKTNYLYKISPVEIVDYTIYDYGREFVIVPIDRNSFEVKQEDTESRKGFTQKGTYGVPVGTPFFSMTVNRLNDFDSNIYFRFRDPVGLEDEFFGRLSLKPYQERSTVYSVSLTGENTKRDEDFINEICQQYQIFNLSRKNDAAVKTIAFIDEQLGYLSDSLINTEEKMRNFRNESGIIDLSNYASQLIGKGNEIERAFTAMRLKETYLDYLTNYLDGNVKDNNIMTPAGLGVTDGTLTSSVNELIEMNKKLSQIGENNPYYPIYTKQLHEIRARMYQVLKNLRMTIEIEKSDLRGRQKELSSGIVSLTDKERVIQNIQRHHKINENFHNFLLQKRADAQIKRASNSPDIVILDKARTGGAINAGVKSKTYSTHIMIGLILPLIFVVLRTYFDNTIKTRRDIEKMTPFPVIGTTLQTAFKERVPVLGHPKSLFTEKFREIRTRVEFVAQKTKGITVMLTSTEPGDGKTFLSANLAAVYGHGTGKTLLIDMDYRRPSVSRLLGIQAEKGVSNYLIGQVSLEDILIKDKTLNFDVLPAGTVPPNPGELIKMDKLHKLLDQLKQEYDYIVIDTSPIGLVSDGYTISGMVDLMLFVVRYNKTNKKFFKNTISQLRQDGLKDVNIILNDVDSSAGYGYSGNYGNSRYYGFWKKSSYHTDRAGYYAEEYFDPGKEQKDK